MGAVELTAKLGDVLGIVFMRSADLPVAMRGSLGSPPLVWATQRLREAYTLGDLRRLGAERPRGAVGCSADLRRSACTAAGRMETQQRRIAAARLGSRERADEH
jgi:hypothetical protein